MIAIKKLLARPIAFNRAFVDLTGSVQAGLMLSQAYYWSDKTKDGWFYKSAQDWEDETGLSRREQETARKALKKTGFWLEKLKGVPATLHFKIDMEKMFSSLADLVKLDATKAPDLSSQKGETLFTETTTETTTPVSPKGDSKKPVLDFPEYKDFIAIWDAKYHAIGLKMPRDGAKVKAIITETRAQLEKRDVVPTFDNTVEFWKIFIENLHRTWGHGKDLSVIESKYPSLIFELENGNKARFTSKANARDQLRAAGLL